MRSLPTLGHFVKKLGDGLCLGSSSLFQKQIKHLIDPVRPIGQVKPEGGAEFCGVEAGIRRAGGGGGIFGGGDGVDALERGLEREFCGRGFGDYMLRESMPVCLAGGGEVVEAEGEIFAAIAEVAGGDVGGGVGEECCSGGSAELVGDDAEFVPTRGKSEDGFDEVFPVGAEDPAGSENEMIGATGGQGFFTCELGLAVDAERVRGIGFVVGGGFSAIENVVGRIVDNECAEFRGLLAEDARGVAIHSVGQIRLGLGFIDRRVSAGAEDHMRLGRTHGGADRVGIREIAGIPSAGCHITKRSQRALELEPKLAVGASDEKTGHFE